MKRPTQAARILAMLEAAGARGLTQLEAINATDGGRPILALSQRVGELIRDGHSIESRRERTAGGSIVARYVLTDERSRATVARTPPPERSSVPKAQPEEEPLVHVTHPAVGRPA